MSLPLPIACLVRRAWNAKDPKARHDTAYYGWEASVRLAVAARPPADAQSLAMASVGSWVAAAAISEQILDDAALLAAYGLWCDVGLGRQASPRTLSSARLLEPLPAYRNHVLGHGAVREPDFYDGAAERLIRGLEAAWARGLFWPSDARLVQAEAVELDAGGARRARLLELDGLASSVVDPRGHVVVPAHVLPRRLYLRVGEEYRPLHPWLLYRAGELREQVLFFNGRQSSSRYLDYVSGEEVRGKALAAAFPTAEDEVRALFGGAGAAAAAPTDGDDPAMFGDYRLLGKLGEGGMGQVHVARQDSLGRLVALKVLLPSLAEDAVAVARFQREVAALSRCDHPNVIKVFGSGQARGTHYYSMELIDGADLSEVAAELPSAESVDAAVARATERVRKAKAAIYDQIPSARRPPSSAPAAPALATPSSRDPSRALAILFRDAARAAQHLHDLGIIHRDIKPANLMLTATDRRVVLMDLGLAALGDASRSITRDKSTLLGTLRYMPPEQLQRNLLAVDQRADIYSLGATFYELLCRRPFFDGDTEAQLIQQVLNQRPVPPARANPKLPPDLARILAKAVEKDPALRYATAEALAADLEAFLDGRPILARPPTLSYVFKLAIRRHRALAATIVAALAAVTVVTGLELRALRLQRDRARAAEHAAEENFYDSMANRALAEDAMDDRVAAETLAAFVLRHGERPDLRGLVVKLSNTWRPKLTWEQRVPSGPCRELDLSPDGKRVVCTGAAGLRDYELATGRPGALAAVTALGGKLDALAFSPDGTRVAAGGEDGRLRVASWPAADDWRTVLGEKSAVTSVAFSRDGRVLAAGLDRGDVVILDGAAPARRLAFHHDTIRALAFSPDDTTLAAGSDDRAISLWTRRDWTRRFELKGHVDCVTALAFAADDALISASDDSTLRVWDPVAGRETARLDGHERAVNALALAGTTVASGGRDRTVRVWDYEHRRELGRVTGYQGTLRSLLLSPDGKLLVTASDDGLVRAWTIADGGRAVLEGATQDVTSLAFSDDGRWLAAGSRDDRVLVWDEPFGARPPRSLKRDGDVWALAFSRGGALLASAGVGPGVELWSGAALERTSGPVLPLALERVRALAFSPDGRTLATGGSDDLVRLWDVRDQTAIGAPLARHSDFIYALAFSPDGKVLASAGRDGLLQLWDAHGGGPVGAAIAHPGWVTSVAFTPDGKRVVTGCRDGLVRIFDVASRALVSPPLAGHDGWVLSVAVSPNGELIASGGEDRTVRLWSARRGVEVARLVDHKDLVWTVAFSPRGDRLASGSRDDSIRVWELDALERSGEELLARAERDFGARVVDARLVVGAGGK